MKASNYGFLAVSVVLLLLPLYSYLPFFDRAILYKTMDARRSIELAHYKSIFRDDEPITVAFIGLSSMWVGVDAKQVETHLAEKGVEEPKVIMLGANHPGEDLVYVMAKDLLENRSVDLLVLSNPNRAQEHPHPMLHRLISLKDHSDVWSDLTSQDKLRSYGLSVLGAPYQLYSFIKPSYEPKDKRKLLHRNGSWIRSNGWAKGKFDYFDPHVTQGSVGDENRGLVLKGYQNIDFDNVFTAYQSTYFRKTVELARSHGAHVALLATPTWYDRDSDKLKVRVAQPLVETLNLPVIGVIPSQLFSGLTDGEIEKLYYDRNHFNSNGARFHTEVVSGAIDGLMDDL